MPTPFSNVSIDDPRPAEPLDLSPFLADEQAPPATSRTFNRPGPRHDWYEPPAPPPVRGPALRLLPHIGEPERWWKRSLFLVIALAVTAGFFFFLFSFWAPAIGRLGVDENAYLVGGRNFADHWSTGFKPADDFEYVGLMWVQSLKNGWYYPKYPMGLSVLYGIALKLGGAAHGVQAALLVNPIAVSLALLATFLLVRSISSSFFGVCAMLLLGFNYTTLERANNPDSHATALFFVAAGMYLLMRWWQTGSVWRGALAGLLLGAAVTVRYNEAMLLFPLFPLDHFLADTEWFKAAKPVGGHLHWVWLLVKGARFLPIGPIGIAVLFAMRWRRLASYVHCAVPLIAWAIPVGAMIAFNFKTLDAMAGYDLTRESEGFSTGEFLSKWQFTVQQLYMFGLFLTLPLGVAGMALLFRRSVRTALFVTLWFVPGALLYNAYYWGNHVPGVGFLRFYLTFLPPIIAAAMWLIYAAGRLNLSGVRPPSARPATPLSHAGVLPYGVGGPADEPEALVVHPRRGSIAAPIGAGILTAAATAIGLMICLKDLDIEQRQNIDLSYSAAAIHEGVEHSNKDHALPVVFCDEGLMATLLEFMQFSMKADWYAADAFDQRYNGAFGAAGFQVNDEKKPVIIQQERIEAQRKLLHGKTAAQLVGEQHKVIDAALAAHRPVYAVLKPYQLSDWKRRYLVDGFEAEQLAHWTEPCNVPNQADNGPLAPPGWPDFLHRGRQELTLVRITHKKAAEPTTAPTSQP